MNTRFYSLIGRLTLALPVWCLSVVALRAELVITNARVVNTTPSEFSVFFRTDESAETSLSVFSDAGGAVSLQGAVGVEAWPVRTGSPISTNRYEYRVSREGVRSEMMAKGLQLYRVTGCSPATDYYFRVAASTNGFASSVTWPSGGAFAVARTAEVNTFVPDSRQLVVEVPGDSVRGHVGTLDHAGAAYPLVAVTGDGAAHNQLYFNLSDLFATGGGSNLVLSGDATFEITVYGPLNRTDLSRDYAMAFGTNLVVARADALIADAAYLYIDIGETNVLSSQIQSFVPISVISAPEAQTIEVDVDLDGMVFTNLGVIAQHPSVGSAVMTPLGVGRYRITLTAAVGQSIHHTTLQETIVARLAFGMDPLQRTAHVPVHIADLAVTDQTNAVFSSGVLSDGAILVVGRNPYLEWMDMSDALKSFTLHGVPGTNYVVEISTDLVQGAWSNWFEVSMGAANLAETVDLPATNAPVLFLRVREKP